MFMVLSVIGPNLARATPNISTEKGHSLGPFEVVAQTGENPKIILIGNTHDSLGKETPASKQAKIENGMLMELLAASGDILLLEGQEHGKPGVLGDGYVNKEFNVFGWDSWIAYKWMDKFRNDAEQLQREGNPYYMVKVLQFENINLVQRNRVLSESATTQATRNPEKRVFVFAGTFHVYHPELIKDLTNSNIPFTIYAPKGSKVQYEKDQERIAFFRREIQRANPGYDIDNGIKLAAEAFLEEFKSPSKCAETLMREILNRK